MTRPFGWSPSHATSWTEEAGGQEAEREARLDDRGCGVLVAARFALRAWIELYVTPLQTGALYFLLAFGAIALWRVSLVRQYLKLSAGAPSA